MPVLFICAPCTRITVPLDAGTLHGISHHALRAIPSEDWNETVSGLRPKRLAGATGLTQRSWGPIISPEA